MEIVPDDTFHYLLIGSGIIVERLQENLGRQNRCTIYSKNSKPSISLFSDSLTGIIIHITADSFIQRKSQILHFKESFYAVPIIVVLSDRNIELAYSCGKIGVDKVLDFNDGKELNNIITSVVDRCKIDVKLDEFKLDLKNPSLIIQKALKFIESNYVSLMGVTEIAEWLGVTESYLSREFKRNKLIGPKKILLYFKVRHAIKLMSRTNTPLKRIASMAGFTNEKRLIELFNKLFFVSPNEYRRKMMNENEHLIIEMVDAG